MKTEKYRFADHESYQKKLMQAPPSEGIKTRKLGGGKTSTYEVIEVKEAIADVIYREWNVVDEKYMNVLNEVVCTVKILALPDYPGADHITFTGSASKAVQTDKGSKVHEFPLGKKSNALEYCLPAARSEAIGNAFSSLGNIFGRNLNREVTNNFGYDLSYQEPKK